MVAPWTSWRLEIREVRAASRYAWLESMAAVHGPAVRRMLRRMLGNEDDALDTYQECICQLARRSGEIPLRSAAGYAYRTAANLALETIRTRRRRAAHRDRVVASVCDRRDLRSDEPAGFAESSPNHLLVQLRQAVQALPNHLRDVVVLRDLGELPYSRVAGILGIRATTARVYRRQAIIRLNRMLASATAEN
ncbi:MAG TPA: sigma-70 family RNA polymerase sigma factor [Phycisphaerae bacterium]|nr:sigma-70 family RNA polymerase sigma factor [Phycisphaerae bacterium]